VGKNRQPIDKDGLVDDIPGTSQFANIGGTI
jgi:hypothetical protein